MKTHNLSSVQALQPGAEIWILPPPHESPWAARVDWYLNFQMSRGLKNRSATRSPVLEKLLGEIKWALPAEVSMRQSPLLIASQGRLPADWLLIPENWAKPESLFAPIVGLKCMHLRLFAPPLFDSNLLKNGILPSTTSIEIVNAPER